MIHQVLVAMAISHEREPLTDRVVCNAFERGATIACRLPLTYPSPSRVYKHSRQPAAAESSQRQHSAIPSPSSRGAFALQEILALTPTKLLPTYPCIGHHLPPSSSAASFQCVLSREHLNNILLGPPKDPPADARGRALKKAFQRNHGITPFIGFPEVQHI